MIRAVIDVNIYVSGAIAPLGASREILKRFATGHFVPIASNHIVAELNAKLVRKDIVRRFRLTDTDRSWIVGIVAAYAERVLLGADDIVDVTGDPEDDAVLATVAASGADYLVTGDKALLARASHGSARIVSPRQFIEVLGQ